MSERRRWTRREAYERRRQLEEAAEKLPDEKAADAAWMYAEFEEGMTVIGGKRYSYNGNLYRCILPDGVEQVCDPGWNPENAPSLFSKVLPGQDGTQVGEWQRPSGTNGYKKGDKCIYNGLVHESTIDNNVWSPAEYPDGWKVVPS